MSVRPGDLRGTFERLERSAVKVARSVLRGASLSNGVGLLECDLHIQILLTSTDSGVSNFHPEPP